MGYFTFYARRIMMIILIIIIILNFLIIIIIILLITMLTILLTTISLKNTIPSKHYLQFLSIKKHLVLIRKKKLKHIKLLIIHFITIIIIIIIIIYSSRVLLGTFVGVQLRIQIWSMPTESYRLLSRLRLSFVNQQMLLPIETSV